MEDLVNNFNNFCFTNQTNKTHQTHQTHQQNNDIDDLCNLYDNIIIKERTPEEEYYYLVDTIRNLINRYKYSINETIEYLYPDPVLFDPLFHIQFELLPEYYLIQLKDLFRIYELCLIRTVFVDEPRHEARRLFILDSLAKFKCLIQQFSNPSSTIENKIFLISYRILANIYILYNELQLGTDVNCMNIDINDLNIRVSSDIKFYYHDEKDYY